MIYTGAGSPDFGLYTADQFQTAKETEPLVGILPERDMMPALGRRLAITNNLLEKVCLPRGVAFVSIDRAPLITEAGDLTYSHSADRLHLNELGYRQLATWILEDGGALAALLN